MKKMIATIDGYRYFALASAEDAIRLADVLSRAVEVTQAKYTGPYLPVRDPTPLLTGISVEEVGDEPAPKPDSAESAPTYEVPAPAPSTDDDGPF
jgi:hypothetical protein